jgi:glycosyltransferase involved in cell wall biosynthesis
MISVVIPAYNEHLAIADTVRRIRDVLAGAQLRDAEILVVDDGSTDDTAALARQAGAQVISNPHNVGYGHSLKKGVGMARHDTIVITDADGTYPISEIPRLVQIYREGFDMVVGARSGSHYRGSSLKWPMRLLLRFLVEWTAGRAIPDINSGFRVFSRTAVMGYFGQICDGFSFTTSLTLAYMMTSRYVTYTNISYGERIGHSKVKIWRDSIRTLQFIVQAIVYYNPIKIFLLMSLICVAIAVVSIFIGIAFHVATGFTMGTGALLVAIVVFSLGLLADLLRQILSNVPK